MHVVYISDGKAGHRSQALGLYQAMQRQATFEISFEEISIQQLFSLNLLVKAKKNQHPAIKKIPDYIIGVGSHTQLKVWLLGKVFIHAKTIILMKPNLPFTWFDHVIIPEHDGVAETGNVILTKGVLNPIVNQHRHQANSILIALGGSSKRHQWNESKVLGALEQIIADNQKSEIILTTSRRTPGEFLSTLQQANFSSQLQIFPVDDTPQGWIFEQMQQAEAVWVTEDSVSMIYEALTAGCKVGVIEIDRLKQDRITHSIDFLQQQQLIAAVSSMAKLYSSQAMNEAQRVAKIIAF